MATVTLPVANNFTSTGGRYSVSGGSWSDAFAGISWATPPSTGPGDFFVDANINSGFVQLARWLFVIDTSSIPSGATITAASLAITTDSGSGNHADNTTLNLVPTSLTSWTTAAQAARANFTMGTDLGNTLFTTWGGVNSTASITLTAAGIANIVKGGTTFMAMVTGLDVSQTSATGINDISFYSGQGTTPPVFSVTYTLPSSSSSFITTMALQ